MNVPNKHILWVNDNASLIGGAEYYIYHTVILLKNHGVKSTLFYDVGTEVSPLFSNIFFFKYS